MTSETSMELCYHILFPRTYSTIISQAGCVSRLMLSKIFCHCGASHSWTLFCFEGGQCLRPRSNPVQLQNVRADEQLYAHLRTMPYLQ